MPDPAVTRLLELADGDRLTELVVANREFRAPWDPIRTEDHFTRDGQRAEVERALARYRDGVQVPHVIVDHDGTVVGRINLNNIVRGSFQSASLGYWVAREANGRGLATAAAGELVRIAFEELGLHRVEAGTLLHNVGSQQVLRRNGFTAFAVAPQYLAIAGRWQDHVLFQRLADQP